MNEKFKIAVVGSGPSGLSAAAHAAELKVPHILLEAEQHPADTIYKYQKGKHVMAEPGVLPLRSPMSFSAGTREAILGAWDNELKKYAVNIRYGAQVAGISGTKGDFTITLSNKQTVQAEHVILSIGLQGNIRKLGVAGEDLPNVQYQLDDPEEFSDETIIVVGAGDAAIENALGLAKQNRVVLINRNDEFARCKEGNLSLVLAAISEGKLECRYGTKVERVDENEPGADFPMTFHAKTPTGAEAIPCHRVIGRLGATPPRKLVEGFGITFPNDDPKAVPVLSPQYESNVPGIYIVGALGGYPLIKQAMNQGYEAVEYILGNLVEPADEPVLKAKFKNVKITTVTEAVQHIQNSVPLLSGLTLLQLRELLLESEIHRPAEGEVVFAKNDYTNSFYSIVEGSVVVEATTTTGAPIAFKLEKGDFFGELGLLSGRRRTATVRAEKRTLLLETPRRAMLKLIASVDSVRKTLDQVMMRRAIRQYLSATIRESEVDYLVGTATIKKYATNDVLFKEGDVADGLYLIRRGSVTVSRLMAGKEIVLSYVAAGNYVGEMALLSAAPRSATVKAAVPTEAIMLEAKRFNEVMSSHSTVRASVDSRSMDRMRSNQAMESGESGNIISFLMKQGLGEATDVLLIDEALCVRCDNCEKACAETHGGTSRLNREAGPTYAQIHVPTSCRHCEHPHCMKDCPPDAIHRSAGGEVFIADTCIGCGNCQKNCPYGVIQMAPVADKKSGSSLVSWLLFGVGREPGPIKASYDKSAPKKAVKCDMCKDQKGGPACVRSCPTGAALRVSPEKFMSYTASD
ncbi:MAG TPA: cyclic nucleotide-binding domain-containing protein [Usitatibacteraceae bacterium]|nr:cyclic nucleotide-binding domain-containing protein [Usitatibacteraceae bacterium]